MKVRVIKKHLYAGRRRAKGDMYHIDKAKDLKLLTAIKCVKPVIEPVIEAPKAEEVKPVAVEQKHVYTPRQNKKQKKRGRKKSVATYSRKDMVAESSGYDFLDD